MRAVDMLRAEAGPAPGGAQGWALPPPPARAWETGAPAEPPRPVREAPGGRVGRQTDGRGRGGQRGAPGRRQGLAAYAPKATSTADAARGMAWRDRFGSASALPRRGLGAAAGSYDRPAGHRPHTGLRSPSLPHPRCLSQGDSELFPSGVGVELRIPRTQTGLRRDLADEPGRSV